MNCHRHAMKQRTTETFSFETKTHANIQPAFSQQQTPNVEQIFIF